MVETCRNECSCVWLIIASVVTVKWDHIEINCIKILKEWIKLTELRNKYLNGVKSTMDQEAVSDAGNFVTGWDTTGVSSNNFMHGLVNECEYGYNLWHVKWSPGVDSCKALLIKIIIINLVPEIYSHPSTRCWKHLQAPTEHRLSCSSPVCRLQAQDPSSLSCNAKFVSSTAQFFLSPVGNTSHFH
jgi:hypothetical protein